MRQPVVASDGRNYEREAIETWLQLGNRFFPGGASRVTSRDLITNEELQHRIQAWEANSA